MRVTILLSVLFISSLCHAQLSGDVTVTPFIGISNSVFASSADVDYKSQQGISAGITGNYFLSESWSLRTGVMYTSMGGEEKATGREERLGYIAVPVNISLHVTKYKDLSFNFGPMFLFNTASEEMRSDNNEVEQDFITNDYDFGVNLGVGYRIPLDDRFDLYFDAQGYAGFIDVYDNVNELFEVRNFAVAVHVGTRIKL
ncbi:porin family protein [Nonlabens ponticola]|uniref:PorT family protein n=1 Tax=Nonlabens ponticola TaxID=2496866 RepID=A0A3S9MXK7_9FLAO|nr:porin family protein [Nonlabens ponticola]AZQ43783.1 PorT family protein [Nonlabens ponticola]